jgi:hypothetical protein
LIIVCDSCGTVAHLDLRVKPRAFSTHNTRFGNDGSAANQFAHTKFASVTADAASVHAAEVAITGIIPSLI